jgi:16S rRNA (cytosine1402-N4)-methyltransferase
MLNEVLSQARLAMQELARPLRFALDGTFGRGGHSRALLDEHPTLRILAFDQDATAIQHAESRFGAEIHSGRVTMLRANFSEIERAQDWLNTQNEKAGFDFLLFDLGVSSPQLDNAERGFSFYHDGPLDMRMDERRSLTAASVLNEWSESELNRLFQESGEIERPFKVVRAIVNDRARQPFVTTTQLAGLVERVDGWAKKGFHPATQYFMALRMEVNAELESLEQMLPKAMRILAPGGKLAIITFHSLEDRIVKNFLRSVEDEGSLGQHFGEAVKRKPIVPSEEEVKRNSRARSAKLRVFRRFSIGESKPPKNKYAHLAQMRHAPRRDEEES